MENELNDAKQILLIAYCHCDYAWTNTRQWHVLRYIQCFETLCEVLDRVPAYTFTLDNVLHSLKPLRVYHPTCFQKIQDFVKQGRIEVVNGGAALIRPNNCGDETFLRNIVAAKKVFFEDFGVKPTVFFNADTGFGHSQLPQILQLTGHDSYRVYRPDGAMTAAGIPGTFIYVGQDGSEIAVSRGRYHAFADAKYLEAGTYDDHRAGFIREELRPVLASKSTQTLCLLIGGDDVQPLHAVNDREIPLLDFIEQWNEKEQIPVKFSSMTDFFASVKTESLPKWSAHIDECDLSYNIPLRTQWSMHRFRFLLERQLIQLEKLVAMAACMQLSEPAPDLLDDWDQLFDISGHAHEMLLADDYAEKLELAISLQRRLMQETQAVGHGIAKQVSTIADNQYVVFNCHPWTQRKCVRMHLTSAGHLKPFYLENAGGQRLPYQIICPYYGDKTYVNARMNEADVIVELDLPPFGYETVALKWLTAEVAPACTLESDAAISTFPQGVPMSLSEILPYGGISTAGFLPKDVFGQLRFYETKPTGDWLTNFDPLRTCVFQIASASVLTEGLLSKQIQVCGHLGDEPAKLLYTFYRENTCFDLEIEIDSQGQEGFYTLAFTCDADAQILAGIPFGTESRDPDHTAYAEAVGTPDEPYLVYERAYRGQYFARHFTTFSVNGSRFGLLQGDGSIYYCKNKAENLVEVVLKKSLDMKRCDVPWTKKMHRSTDGRGVHTFHLQGFCAEGLTLTNVHQLALENEQPPLVIRTYGPTSGKLPARNTLLQLEQLPVSAVFTQGDKLYIRAYEVAGRETHLALSGTKKTALLEKMPGQDKAEEIVLSPFEIATIEMTLS